MFGDKLFPNIGYPTPTSIPDDTSCLTLQVPANAEWWGLVVGALYALMLEWQWQQFEGGLSVEDTTARWQLMLEDALTVADTTNSCVPLTDQPPYWDGTNGENADNENPSSTGFPWYENIAWEFVEGFVATLVGVPAAHSYITVTKKLRLLYLARSSGGIFNVEIDGDTVASVDTYAASEGIGYVDVVIP